MEANKETSPQFEKEAGASASQSQGAERSTEAELKGRQPSVEAAPPVEDMSALERLLEEEKAKAQQYLANWQRAQADFINYRKRMEQERLDTVKFSNAMLVSSILPVLDDLERAFETVSSKLAGLTWVDGVKLIYRKLQAILEAQGLREIKAVGEEFDSRFHEAVLFVEGEEGKVVEEVQRGYMFHERVLRPAMVKIGKAKENKSKEAQTPEASGQGSQGEENPLG